VAASHATKSRQIDLVGLRWTQTNGNADVMETFLLDRPDESLGVRVRVGRARGSPRWFAKKVRQVCDRVVGLPRSYRDTVRSEKRRCRASVVRRWIRRAPPQAILRSHAPNQIFKCWIDRWSSRSPRAAVPASSESVTNSSDRRWLAGPSTTLRVIRAERTARPS